MCKKAQVAKVLYFPFILFCAILVVFGFAYLPANTLDDVIQVSSLDGFIARKSFENKVSYTDPLTLRVYPMTLKDKDDFKSKVSEYFIVSGKDAAYRISFDGKTDTLNEDLFLLASRTSPLGEHLKIDFQKQVICLDDKDCGTARLEQVLPKVYYVE